MSTDWGKRIFWMTAMIAVFTLASAVTSVTVRVKLDERDATWKRRLDALESDVALVKRRSIAQDDLNDRLITWMEKDNARPRNPQH